MRTYSNFKDVVKDKVMMLRKNQKKLFPVFGKEQYYNYSPKTIQVENYNYTSQLNVLKNIQLSELFLVHHLSIFFCFFIFSFTINTSILHLQTKSSSWLKKKMQHPLMRFLVQRSVVGLSPYMLFTLHLRTEIKHLLIGVCFCFDKEFICVACFDVQGWEDYVRMEQ